MLERIPEARLEALAEAAEAYVHEAFGRELNLAPIKPNNLPHFVLDRYAIWRGSLNGRALALMAIREPRQGATSEFVKHRELVRHQTNVDFILLLLDRAPTAIRRQMMDRQIGFIAPGAQLYVPEAFLDLRERASGFAISQTEQISPTTQFMILAILQGLDLEGRHLTGLADVLGVSIMSISRSLDELEAIQIAEPRIEGRQRQLRMLIDGRELWDATQDRFRTPVRKTRVISGELGQEAGPFAGESALARYTMLAPPKIETRAVLSGSWKRIAETLALRPATGLDENRIEVQTWTYDPQRLARDGVVDRLSLYLSARESPDERVAQAAGELLETIAW